MDKLFEALERSCGPCAFLSGMLPALKQLSNVYQFGKYLVVVGASIVPFAPFHQLLFSFLTAGVLDRYSARRTVSTSPNAVARVKFLEGET
jgi:hypothetical protein